MTKPIARHVVRLKAQHCNAEAALVIMITAGGTWSQLRPQLCGLSESATCPRCLRADETEARRCWTCPTNRAHKAHEQSDHQLAKAIQQGSAVPTFWLRANLPCN